MTTRLVVLLGIVLPAWPAAAQSSSVPSGMPMMPIAPSQEGDWQEAYILETDTLRAVIAADIGRLVWLGKVNGPNLLNLSDEWSDRTHPADDAVRWRDYGGNWLWPVAQGRWEPLTGTRWPPPAFLNERRWDANAWKSDDGSLHCLVTHRYDAPLSVTLTREITVQPGSMRVAVRQRIERTGPSSIPVCLWQVSQVVLPDHLVLPAHPESRFERRYLSTDHPPVDGVVRQFGDILFARSRDGGEFKLGVDSARHWVAARLGDTLFMARATRLDVAGEYPEHGCTAEVYSNDGLGHAEMRIVSKEVDLPPGEHIENTVHLSLLQVPPNLTLQTLSAWVNEQVGVPALTTVTPDEPAAETSDPGADVAPPLR